MPDALRKGVHHALLELLEAGQRININKNVALLQSLRQAALRLQVLLKRVRDEMPAKTYKRARKRLRSLLSQLERIDNIDRVMRDLLMQGEGSANRMAIAGIIAQLDAQRLQTKQSLQHFLESKKYRKFAREIREFALADDDKSASVGDPTKPHLVRHVLPYRLQKRMMQTLAYDTLLGTPESDWLSGLEKRTHQLRALLEAFQPVLGTSAAQCVDHVARLQTDIEQVTARERMLTFVIHLPQTQMNGEQRDALRSYRKQLQAQRDQAYKDFGSDWERFRRRQVLEAFYRALLVLR